MDKPLENFGLQKDMQDIDDILNQYFQIGRINREKAIAKIRELRITIGSLVKSKSAGGILHD